MLDAALGARRPFDLGADSVLIWLARTRPDTAAGVLASRIANADDGQQIAKALIVSSGSLPGRDPVFSAAEQRLSELNPDARDWDNAARLVIAHGGRPAATPLLARVVGQRRMRLIRALADTGDGDAQVELLLRYAEELSSNTPEDRPSWRYFLDRPDVIDALVGVYEAARRVGHDTAAGYALGELGQYSSEHAVARLRALALQHPDVRSVHRKVARRNATIMVLDRLPDELAAVATAFSSAAATETGLAGS